MSNTSNKKTDTGVVDAEKAAAEKQAAEAKAGKEVEKAAAEKQAAEAKAKEEVEKAAAEKQAAEAKADEEAQKKAAEAKKMNPAISLTKQYAKAYPANKVFYVTSDMQVFLEDSKNFAVMHQSTLKEGALETIML